MRFKGQRKSLINQKIMKRLLEKEGKHTCDVENNGEEAVRLWEQKDYDIILMDMQMPVMCGLEATKIIRTKEQGKKQEHSPIPIIGISGNAREEQADEAKSQGMDDYLTKPFNTETLLEKINFYTAIHDNSKRDVGSSSSGIGKKRLFGE